MEEKITDINDEKKKGFFAVNKNLVMLKFTLFFLYGATSSLMPYLTIHMQSIGLTIEEIALIYLALPFTTFLAPPITGFLVDKFGQYKPVVIISFILTAAVHHSLLLIPHQEQPSVMPSGYVMRHPQGDVEVWWSPCPSRECPDEEELDLVLDTCVDHCLLSKSNDVTELPNSVEKSDPGEDDDLAFHVDGGKIKLHGATHPAVNFLLDMYHNLGDPTEALGIPMDSREDDDSADFKTRFPAKLLQKAGVNLTELEDNDLRCGGVVLRANYTSKAKTNLEDWTADCIVQRCNFREGGPQLCPPDYKESDDATFWIYFVLRFLGTIMMTAGVTIMDPIALTMIEKYGGDFGREKLFSSLGMALFSPITGALIDADSRRLGYTDYSAAFYTYDILLMVSAITVYLMPLGTKLPADNMFRDLVNIFKMANVIVFIIFLFFLGNLWGFIESFLFLYLRNLGAPNYLLGITVTVGTLSSLPFLYGAEKITQKIGHVNIIIIAFFAHAGRLMGYSFIESAWWCFPFEAMESLSVHLMWVAAATYCAILAPKKLLATLIGVIGMSHFSIGRGSGSFIGGYIIGKIGIRHSFRVMGAAAVIAGTTYLFLHYFWLRKTDLKQIIKQEENANNEYANETKTDLDEKPKMVDQSTMVSFERLSLVIEYNAVGSLTSLGRQINNRDKINSLRRGSEGYGMYKRGSASKVDLLRSAVEVNSRNSFKNSVLQLNRHMNSSSSTKIIDARTSSAPRLAQKSSSLSPIADKELDKLIPDETEEIIYNTKIEEDKTQEFAIDLTKTDK